MRLPIEAEFDIDLENPYQLGAGFPFWLKLYRKYPGIPRGGLFRSMFRVLFHLTRAFGFSRIQRGKHEYFDICFGSSNRKFRARDTNAQFASVYFDEYAQVYEPDVTAMIMKFLGEGDVFADIGANWGHFSYHAIAEKGVEVLAFEPNPLVAEDLRSISLDLDVEDKIQIFQCALSDKKGTIELTQRFFESGQATVDEHSLEGYSHSTISKLHTLFDLHPLKYEVTTCDLDSLEIEKLDFIKIDAEGAEFEILSGAIETIANHKPYICFEFHSGNLYEFRKFEKIFGKLNYSLHQIKVDKLDHSKSKFHISLVPLNLGMLDRNRLYNILAYYQPSRTN